MGTHLIEGEFQSDKYPTTPRGLVPLKPTDPMAQDLLWEYARRRREIDAEFADDLEAALKLKGYVPKDVAKLAELTGHLMGAMARYEGGGELPEDFNGFLSTLQALIERFRADHPELPREPHALLDRKGSETEDRTHSEGGE